MGIPSLAPIVDNKAKNVNVKTLKVTKREF
jgi:hypothetical protein